MKVPTSAITFALLSGVSAATWTICLKLGSTKINAALGAMVITAVAFLVNSVAMVTMRAQGREIVLKQDAFWLLAGAGIAAAGVDIFALLAYERGLRVTSSLIIGGTSTALVLLVGFVALQEPLTGVRALAIVLIAVGIFLLQAQAGRNDRRVVELRAGADRWLAFARRGRSPRAFAALATDLACRGQRTPASLLLLREEVID
jgi:uncharacterized membrane protein